MTPSDTVHGPGDTRALWRDCPGDQQSLTGGGSKLKLQGALRMSVLAGNAGMFPPLLIPSVRVTAPPFPRREGFLEGSCPRWRLRRRQSCRYEPIPVTRWRPRPLPLLKSQKIFIQRRCHYALPTRLPHFYRLLFLLSSLTISYLLTWVHFYAPELRYVTLPRYLILQKWKLRLHLRTRLRHRANGSATVTPRPA